MFRKVVDQQVHRGIRIEHIILGELEKAAIGIEAGLQQLGQEFSEEAAAVDASFLQSRSVEQLHPHLQPQFRLILARQFHESVLVKIISPHGNMYRRTLHEMRQLALLFPLVLVDQGLEHDDAIVEWHDERYLP